MNINETPDPGSKDGHEHYNENIETDRKVAHYIYRGNYEDETHCSIG